MSRLINIIKKRSRPERDPDDSGTTTKEAEIIELPVLDLEKITELITGTLDYAISILIVAGTHAESRQVSRCWGYYNAFRNCMNNIIDAKYLIGDVSMMLKDKYPSLKPAFETVSRDIYRQAIPKVIGQKKDSIKMYWDHYLDQCKLQRESKEAL